MSSEAFSVRPEMITAYGNVVTVQCNHAEQAHRYVADNTKIDTSQGSLLDKLYDSHDKIVRQVTAGLDKLADLSRNSGSELKKTAFFYVETDTAQIKRLDRAYGQVNVSRRDEPCTIDEVSERQNPESRLSPPTIPDGFYDPFSLYDDLKSIASLSAQIEHVLQLLGVKNPAGELADLIVGDWQAYAKCGSVWRSIGEFYAAVGDNIEWGVAELDVSWNGNAADRAYGYFSGFAKTLLEQQAPMNTIASRYMQVAKGVYDLADDVKGAITGIIDNAFWAAMEIAAGGESVETVVGPAVLWSVAFFQCKRVVDEFDKATKGLDDLRKFVTTTAAWFDLFANNIDQVSKYPLPAHAYDHPSVK
ncbi:MAG TPA: hypothetical protein VHF06_18495 [Pseudonocardiaceae bacterium]|nr:hypothetical protein [Pseudonocardiaceae bacterium]